MNKVVLFTCLICLFTNVSAQNPRRTITIENPSNLNRSNELVRVSWAEVLKAYPAIDTANFEVINKATAGQIPYQLEKLGGKDVKFLLLQVSVKAKSKLLLQFVKGKPNKIDIKTYGRYVPERKDDFTWENDKIAFRMYGKALENTNENAHGMDVWVKRTSAMVINKRYKVENYHKDHGDGLDYYSVGTTLGAGDMAPYLADTVWYLGNYSSYKILDNGPLRTSFHLIYDEALANGVKIKVTKQISIDAGSQLNRVENSYTFNGQEELHVAVGLATRKEEKKEVLTNANAGILGYWEPIHGEDGITGVGAIFIKSPVTVVQKNNQLLGITSVKANQLIVYYAGAAWNKAGEITNSKEWFDYLLAFNTKLKQPLVVNSSSSRNTIETTEF
ncbi:MAG: DUF4861 domain-containing protein [Pedobacter sp.]|nr:MAG: DUF4861 domain-containing protein [Pedobacter sp.]